MSQKISKCTTPQFEGLHSALDKVRSTSATVTVDKQALRNLLIDHGDLWAGVRLMEKE